MDPLDSIIIQVQDDDSVVCAGTFSYIPDYLGVDWVLGDSFLR